MVVIVEKKLAIISQWMSFQVSMAQLCSAGLSEAQWDALRLSGVLWGSPGLIGGLSGGQWGSVGLIGLIIEGQCVSGAQQRVSGGQRGSVNIIGVEWGSVRLIGDSEAQLAQCAMYIHSFHDQVKSFNMVLTQGSDGKTTFPI